jgi:hypothetical protein
MLHADEADRGFPFSGKPFFIAQSRGGSLQGEQSVFIFPERICT